MLDLRNIILTENHNVVRKTDFSEFAKHPPSVMLILQLHVHHDDIRPQLLNKRKSFLRTPSFAANLNIRLGSKQGLNTAANDVLMVHE